MQISALNLLHSGGATSAPTLTNSASLPMASSNSGQGGFGAQPGAYGAQVQFAQPQLAQGGPTTGVGSSGLANVSGSFPSTQSQMQPNQSMHQQPLPGSHHLQSTYASTGSITNSILPASVVDDPSGGAGTQFSSGPQPGDTLPGSYTWSEAQSHSGMGSQSLANSARPSRLQQSYGQHPQPHLRPQQPGMLPVPLSGNPRAGSSPAGTSAIGGGSNIHSGINGGVGTGVLGHMSGTMPNGMVNGLSSGSGLGVQGSLPGVALGMGQPFPDGDAGGRAFQPSDGLGVLGSGQIRGKQGGRGAFEHNPAFSHHMGSTLGGGQGALPEIGGQSLGDGTFGTGVKQEDTSTGYGRPNLKRTQRPPRRRKGNTPGTPAIPVHLRNPKKGRARVFRKCQYCNHENHIRRSNCDACKQALPAGKRRRDGSLVFSNSKHHTSSNVAAQGIGGPGATGSSQAPAVAANGSGLPMSSLQRPPDPGGNN